jgi:hypothetical protein
MLARKIPLGYRLDFRLEEAVADQGGTGGPASFDSHEWPRISRIDIREMTGMAAGIARAKGAGVSRWVREWITTVQYDTLLTVVISGEASRGLGKSLRRLRRRAIAASYIKEPRTSERYSNTSSIQFQRNQKSRPCVPLAILHGRLNAIYSCRTSFLTVGNYDVTCAAGLASC